MNQTGHYPMEVPTSESGEYVVDGLVGDVEILIDQWGVPHIYASSDIDAYVAQGFQAARDRLFQIDLWRRRGLGKLSEVFGDSYLEQDRANRLFLFRGDMRAEFLSYSTQARSIVSAFVAGVNAYIDWVMEEPDVRLPPEFIEKNYSPSRWEPEDLVRIRTHGLLFNAVQELQRALTLRDLGADAENIRTTQEQKRYFWTDEDGISKDLADDVLRVYEKAFEPVSFGVDVAEKAMPSGSNNWVVAPSRTSTGRPILANDPHRAITLPSLRYLSHIESPGMSIVGAGEPHLPGISIGHNGQIAFGLTIWSVDHEDVYVYQLHPERDDQYRYNGGWEAFETVREPTKVAGTDDEHVYELQFTRHGPIVHIDSSNRIAVAVRAAWLEPGMCPYLGSLEFQKAGDVTTFRESLSRWGAPGVNMIYATPDGNIGWQASALVPRRSGWDGSHPVPGDGRYEWQGFAPLADLPSVENPDSGFFTNSNEFNVPSSHEPNELVFSGDWYSPGRHQRLQSWLEQEENLTLESSLCWQMDARNSHAVEILQRLQQVKVTEHEREWELLQSWDGEESVDSEEALIFQVWHRAHFLPWLLDECLRRLGYRHEAIEKARHRFLPEDTTFSDLRPIIKMLDVFDFDSTADVDLFNSGIEVTLSSAVGEIEQRLGLNKEGWKWGNLHAARLKHPLLRPGSGYPADWVELEPVPRAGSGETVGLSGYDPDFNVVAGSSFRMALDVGEWDNSQVISRGCQMVCV